MFSYFQFLCYDVQQVCFVRTKNQKPNSYETKIVLFGIILSGVLETSLFNDTLNVLKLSVGYFTVAILLDFVRSIKLK